MVQPTTTHASQGGMTFDEWAALDEDEPGELVDGRLEEEEVADVTHEVCAGWLVSLLRSACGAGRGGIAGGSDAKFVVTPRRGRKPDAFAYLPGAPLPPRRGAVRVPPTIAAEVVTPTPRDVRRDRIEKFDEYAAFGVRFYWLLDPTVRMLEIYELQADGSYHRVLGAAEGQHAVPGCEGLTLDLDALWAELDCLPSEERP